MNRIIRAFFSMGTRASDGDHERMRKALLAGFATVFSVVGLLWGAMYYMLGESEAAWIPGGYGILTALGVVLFGILGNFELLRFGQIFLSLLLPWLLMMQLGGWYPSSGVVLWSILAPLAALVFGSPRSSLVWFALYVVLLILGGGMEPFRAGNNLSPATVQFFFVINAIGISCMVFALLYLFVVQRDSLQEKSDTLLLNILPKEIASLLKNDQRTIAEHYDRASILFADVVNFTPLSATLSPIELVTLLDEIFSHFDHMTEKFGLEKIKTIGDCYMVASGVPRQRTDHAVALVGLAIEMRDFVASREFSGRKISFRFGINSGAVVAGVIGRKKFIYDLWGDAVNTASRMESHSAADTIQVTRATFDLIHSHFACEPKGQINVKGKGEMEVWHVSARSEGHAGFQPALV